MKAMDNGRKKTSRFLREQNNFSEKVILYRAEKEEEELIINLKNALGGTIKLRGLIPVCAWCKKIRDDRGYWVFPEGYREELFCERLTHGICPECLEQRLSAIIRK